MAACLSISYSFVVFLGCLDNFEVSHTGYFKAGFIDKGYMSSISACSCMCEGNINCLAYSFRKSLKCFFYEDVSNLSQKVDDSNSIAYIKKSPGKDHLWQSRN